MLYETMGRDRKAEQAYRTAVRMEPLLTGPRSNLAALLDRRVAYELRRSAGTGRQPNEQVVRDQAEARKLRREELDLLARDARLLPGNAAIQHRYGLSLYLNGQATKAETALKAACRIEPDNDYFLFVMATFFDHYARFDEALEALDRAIKLQPSNRQYTEFRQAIPK